jgi:hypothetical protein
MKAASKRTTATIDDAAPHQNVEENVEERINSRITADCVEWL